TALAQLAVRTGGPARGLERALGGRQIEGRNQVLGAGVEAGHHRVMKLVATSACSATAALPQEAASMAWKMAFRTWGSAPTRPLSSLTSRNVVPYGTPMISLSDLLAWTRARSGPEIVATSSPPVRSRLAAVVSLETTL